MTNSQKETYYENVWLWVRKNNEPVKYIDNLIEVERERNENFAEKEELLLRIKDIMQTEESLKNDLGKDIKFHN